MAEHVRNAQLNVRITRGTKQRITALATARKLSITELLLRALDAYALPDVGDRLDNYKHINFAPRHHDLLKTIAKHLRITLAGAVECALEFGLVNLARGALFFEKRIEPAPGERLSHEDLWAAFQEWCSSHRLRGQMSSDEFAAMGHLICDFKKIAVRVRGNQVFCLDVRLHG